MTTTVFGLFKNLGEVNKAIQTLKSQGFEPLQVNWKNVSPGSEITETEPKLDKTEISAALACGALGGVTIGILAGTLWGLSAITDMGTGTGLTISTLGTLLTFIGIGVLLGAVVGTLLLLVLVKLGRSSEKNDIYTQDKNEKVLVAVATPEERVAEVKSVMHAAQAIEGSVL